MNQFPSSLSNFFFLGLLLFVISSKICAQPVFIGLRYDDIIAAQEHSGDKFYEKYNEEFGYYILSKNEYSDIYVFFGDSQGFCEAVTLIPKSLSYANFNVNQVNDNYVNVNTYTWRIPAKHEYNYIDYPLKLFYYYGMFSIVADNDSYFSSFVRNIVDKLKDETVLLDYTYDPFHINQDIEALYKSLVERRNDFSFPATIEYDDSADYQNELKVVNENTGAGIYYYSDKESNKIKSFMEVAQTKDDLQYYQQFVESSSNDELLHYRREVVLSCELDELNNFVKLSCMIGYSHDVRNF